MGTLARIKKKVRSVAGFSIIEGLVAGAIVGTLIMAGYTLMGSLFNFQKRVRDMTAEDRMIASLISNIRSNLSRYQYSMDSAGSKVDTLVDDGTGNLTNVSNFQDSMMLDKPLPIAWSDLEYTTRANCPSCPGELGYWIQPMSGPGMEGLLRIKLRVKHKRLYPKNGYRDYVFMSTFK